MYAAACSSKTSKPAPREAGAGESGVDAGFDAAGRLVLTAFRKGDHVAVLMEGQAVTQLAERNGFFRVTFADPSDGSRPKMGWVVKYAFEAVDAGAPGTYLAAPWCSGTKVLALQTGRPRCDYVWYKDLECSHGDTCEAAIDLPKNGEVPSSLTYTTVCTPPLGRAATEARRGRAQPLRRSAHGEREVPALHGAGAEARRPLLHDLRHEPQLPRGRDLQAGGDKQRFCFGPLIREAPQAGCTKTNTHRSRASTNCRFSPDTYEILARSGGKY